MVQFQAEPSLIAGYLSDESGIAGQAEGICFPQSGQEVAQALRLAQREKKPVTVQGARTGYRGRAVPRGGYILNLSKMNRLLSFHFEGPASEARITAQAGMTLDALNQTLLEKSGSLVWEDAASATCWRRYRESGVTLFFPPNPTEGTASLGGILASGASGAHIHGYGSVQSRAGEVERAAAGGAFGEISVITACTWRLAVRPDYTYALLCFGGGYPALMDFLGRLESGGADAQARLTGADFFDRSCFRLARGEQGRVPSLAQLPSLPSGAAAGMSLELSARKEEALYPLLERALDAMERAGLSPADTLAATTAQEVQKVQSLRHLLTEGANTLSYGREKFVLEAALPEERRGEYPRLLEKLSGALAAAPLPGFLLGHAGVGTLHLRLLPAGREQEALARQLFLLPELKGLPVR